ncbi:DUF2933 domain-containing protein [Rhodococcus marinonascens]|uniref:DUF2933 domain-containing protein n=1 Tax=Rhodococcus marinonascens TaxID=38311 RepID=UPI000933AB38|nr:DUF2933 domain-containing protein [Rhodococcus marinonascens]
MCLNKKVLIGLGAVAVGLLLLEPGWAVVALPLLILAVCPLTMIFMMRGMKGREADRGSGDAAAKPQPAGPSTATEADLGKQITGLQSELRLLKTVNAQRSSAPQLPSVEMTKNNEADTRP